MKATIQFLAVLVISAIVVLAVASFTTVNDFFNKSGSTVTAVTAMLTAAYVFVTFLLLKKTEDVQKESRRPIVVADFEFFDQRAIFSLANVGMTPAKVESIEIMPDIILSNGASLNKAILAQGNIYLRPDKPITTVIEDSPSFLKEGKPKTFHIDVKYSATLENKEYHEDYEVSVAYAEKVLRAQVRDISDVYTEMARIATHLSRIATYVHALSDSEKQDGDVREML